MDDSKFIASISDGLELQEDIDLFNKMVQKLEVVSELAEMWHSQFQPLSNEPLFTYARSRSEPSDKLLSRPWSVNLIRFLQG